MEDANLLAIHAKRYTLQPWVIQLARRDRGEPDWDNKYYTELNLLVSVIVCQFPSAEQTDIVFYFIFLNIFCFIIFCFDCCP